MICDFIGRFAWDLRTQCDLCRYEAVAMMATLGGYLRDAVSWCWNGGARRALETLDRYLRVAFFWFWFCVGILLAIYSYAGYGTGMAAFMLGSVFFIYAVRRLYRASKAAKVQIPDLAFVVYAVLVLGVAIHGTGSFTQEHETNFAPLLAALEQYRDTTGQYPDELDELVPEYVASLPQCPVTGGWSGNGSYYHKRKKGHRLQGTYIVTCVVGVFVFPQYAMYESAHASWMYTD